MENFLNPIRKSTKNKFLYLILTVGVVFLTLAGVVALFSDLGLSNEIIAHRTAVWMTLLFLAIFFVLIYEIIRLNKKSRFLQNQNDTFSHQLEDAKLNEDSLLRLMETYKRAAYSEVLDHLNRLLLIIVKRQQWQESNAKIIKIRVKDFSGAEQIDPSFAAKERIEVIINIGTEANVCEGMEFLVRDPAIPIEYGLIALVQDKSEKKWMKLPHTYSYS